jgi:hypothetical protein
MKAAATSFAVLLLMPIEAEAVDPVTGMAFIKALTAYSASCASAQSEEEYKRRGCFGPGFAVAPKVKRLWSLDYKWRKQCGDIAEAYCQKMSRVAECVEGVEKLHSGIHPECYLSNWRAGASLAKHCGDIAEKYCMEDGQPPACQLGVRQLHSGAHEECDMLKSAQQAQ